MMMQYTMNTMIQTLLMMNHLERKSMRRQNNGYFINEPFKLSIFYVYRPEEYYYKTLMGFFGDWFGDNAEDRIGLSLGYLGSLLLAFIMWKQG